MLKLCEANLRALATSLDNEQHAGAEIFNLLSRLPHTCNDAELLFEVADKVAQGVNDALITTLRYDHMRLMGTEMECRQKHVTLLMAEQKAESLNDYARPVRRRKLQRSKSLIGSIFSQSTPSEYNLSQNRQSGGVHE
jgi:hypothetical protein